MEIHAVRGMHDLFGEEMDRWRTVESRLREIATSFSYQEIRTPVLEKMEVFSHTVGDETDIVEKQMYTVLNEGTEKLVLRPEGTAGFIRSVVEHQLQQTGHPQRFYYYLPMFRHERPQKGRLRQFHQFGAEIINDPSPEADAEIIAVLDQVYRSFGISEYEVRVNSVGCPECRPAYKELLKEYIRPNLDSLCGECQKRFERSPLRILDCKKPNCQGVVQSAPRMVNHLCVNCQGHHSTFLHALSAAHVKFTEDPNIVRGLDYYTRTAFEFTSDLLGAQSALGGGGRYDGISTRFGAKTFPGVGFALGMERLLIALEAKQAIQANPQSPVFYFAPLGEAAYHRLFPLSFALKRRGVPTLMAYEKDKGLKWLMKQADRLNAKYALLLGDDEIKHGKAILKDMKTSEQEMLDLHHLEESLMRKTT